MNDFITQQQCDELTDYRPTAEDWAEYREWLDSVEEEEEDAPQDGWWC